MPRKFFVGGNFKMNGSKAKLDEIISNINNTKFDPSTVDVVVAPPACYLDYCHNLIDSSKASIAAQNTHQKSSGAFTGEISVDFLKDIGIKWTILGHSERRHVFGECNDVIKSKVNFALANGMKVIACIGETLAQREANETFSVNEGQLKFIADALENESQWENVVIAYEPVWAIGTGKTATPDQAQEVHEKLRNWMSQNIGSNIAENVRILYGGSVNAKNCKELAGKPDVDGFLVGGASLKPEFSVIINSNE